MSEEWEKIRRKELIDRIIGVRPGKARRVHPDGRVVCPEYHLAPVEACQACPEFHGFEHVGDKVYVWCSFEEK